MKVAKYFDQKDIRYEEAPVPRVGSKEGLVKMKACGICGSDLMEWYLKDRAPLVLGHEPSGVLTKVGDGVEDFEVGDRVFVHHHVPCLTCQYCLRGAYTMCEQFKKTHIDPGGFAEYFRIPALNLQIDTLKLPDSISFEEATLIEPTACCIRALKKCKVRQGDAIVVVGAGSAGIIHTMLLRSLGVGRIIVSEPMGYRRNMAKKLGADIVINPEEEKFYERVMDETCERGGDVVIVTAPSIHAIASGFEACSKGGTLCIFAPTSPKECLQLSPNKLFFSEITVVSSYSASHLETRTALKLIEAGRIEVGELITHRFPLNKTGEAFKTAIEDKESLKIIVMGDN